MANATAIGGRVISQRSPFTMTRWPTMQIKLSPSVAADHQRQSHQARRGGTRYFHFVHAIHEAGSEQFRLEGVPAQQEVFLHGRNQYGHTAYSRSSWSRARVSPEKAGHH